MRTYFQPVPVGGINASQPYDMMEPTDAINIVNYLPKEESLAFRKGSLKLTTSALGSEVETLATHNDTDGTQTLVAAADDNIYTVNTSTGATTSKGSGFTNNRWQTTNFNGRLLMVNGEDTPQEFDGTTLQNYVATISGATATDLVGITTFKGRCIYWENNASKFWYAGAGAYGGALTSFPLDLLAQKGGYVVECFSWTLDSGEGVDDLFVVVMSTGETFAYQGSDPASDFSLIGRFRLGRPISVRGSTSLSSDRILVTEDGIINLSTALQVGRATERGNVGSKIINRAKKMAELYSQKYGWDMFYHDKESLLIVNIPRNVNPSTPANNVYEQLAMNTNTGAWSRLTDINALCFTEIDGELYGGGSDGHVRKLFTGTSDDGESIYYSFIPAFSMLGMPDRKKQLTFVTLITDFSYKRNIGCAGLSDFDKNARGAASVPNNYKAPEPVWDEIDWDEAFWGGDEESTPQQFNMDVSADGYALSFKCNIYSSIQTANIYSIKYKYKILRSI